MTTTSDLFFDSWPDRISSVTVLVTSACNRDCSYCPQLDRYRGGSGRGTTTRVMDERVLKTALSTALDRSGPSLEVTFSGGEPLLAAPRVLLGVERLRRDTPTGKDVRCRILTNGELLNRDLLDTLLSQNVEIRLSCQALSETPPSPRSRRRLDETLQLLRSAKNRWPSFSVSASLVVKPIMIPELADQVDWLLQQGVDSLGLAPVSGGTAAHEDFETTVLLQQMMEVADLAASRASISGTHPMPMFSGRLMTPPPSPGRLPMCSALDTRDLCVDVDGELSGCSLFATSVSPSGAPSGEFVNRRRMRGGSGQPCVTCEARPRCTPCLWEQWQEAAPHDVPRFRCEFHLITHAIAKEQNQPPGCRSGQPSWSRTTSATEF